MSETGRPLDYGIIAERKPFHAEKQLIRLSHELRRYVEKFTANLPTTPSIDWQGTTNELKSALDTHVQKMETARKSLWISIR